MEKTGCFLLICAHRQHKSCKDLLLTLKTDYKILSLKMNMLGSAMALPVAGKYKDIKSKMWHPGAGETAVLPENLYSIPSMYLMAHNHL